MPKQKRLIGLIIIITVLSFFPPKTCAEIQSSLAVQTEYNDNILLTPENQAADRKLTIIPQMDYTQNHDGSHLALHYNSNLIYYDQHPQQDSFNHYLSGMTGSDPDKRIYLSLIVSDNYGFSYINPRRFTQPVLTDRDLVESNTLEIKPSLRLRLGSTAALIFNYQYNNVDYKINPDIASSGNWRDSQGQGGSVIWEQKITADLLVETGYSYLSKTFDRPLTQQFIGATGYDNQQAQAGLHWQITSETKADFIYNYVWRKYDTGSNQNYSNWQGNLGTKLFADTLLLANYSQLYQDAVFGQSYKSRQAGLDLIQDVGQRFQLSGGISYAEYKYLLSGQTTNSWKTRLGTKTNFSPKLTLNIEGGLQAWDSPNAAGNENVDRKIISAQTVLSYQMFDKFSWSLGYNYTNSQADDINSEYIVNSYFITLKADF